MIMSRAENLEQPLESIQAGLNYIVDTGEKPVTYSNASGGNKDTGHTGKYEEHTVTILNGRPLTGQFSLDREGFIFIEHATQVKNFYDRDEIETVYYRKIEQPVKDVTGASRVIVFDHTLRAADESTREEKQVGAPVRRVHNDYTEWSGPQRVRDLLPREEAEELLKRRFAVVQVWRPIRNPVEATPLAIADARSLDAKNLIATERRYPDRVGEIYHITYDPSHRWFYFPEMKRTEALVFKCYDSEKDGRARWTAHAAFEDPQSRRDAPPRESIEMRTLAFF